MRGLDIERFVLFKSSGLDILLLLLSAISLDCSSLVAAILNTLLEHLPTIGDTKERLFA